MKIKIPPPIVTLIFALGIYALAKYLPVGDFSFIGQKTLMYIVFGVGVSIMGIALLQFVKKKTTTNPLHPEKASSLVTSGIYRYTRNPMYLAMLLFLIAFALKLGNAFNTLLLAGFVYPLTIQKSLIMMKVKVFQYC